MYIKTSYIGKLNGIFGVWCETKPDNAIITETREILFADNGKLLQHKETKEIFSSVCLINSNDIDNYEEIERNN